LQCVAVCCSVLQCVAVCCSHSKDTPARILIELEHTIRAAAQHPHICVCVCVGVGVYVCACASLPL